ncbi:interleukin-12 subunit alpha [Chanos chanos]|uniref:Interleukin-12 subunit alpha n=1 Tax=Chanos chanos TaxID=29144 RepID=A0A6J2VFH3_CHACN|nr:interleukin-12 subunit alpha [Chanos chanos]
MNSELTGWHVSFCSPVGARNAVAPPNSAQCIAFARSLLQNVTEALEIDRLFKGINCTEQSMEIYHRTKTVSACAPKVRAFFIFISAQDNCLSNVMDDLRYYRAAIQAHPDPDIILSPTVRSIDVFMEVVQVHENTFDERLRLCKVLKGFRVRAITINRIINYIWTEDLDE